MLCLYWFLECGIPEGMKRGFVRFNAVAFGSIVSYSCSEGYNLIGTASRECKDYLGNIEWIPDAPVCSPKGKITWQWNLMLFGALV